MKFESKFIAAINVVRCLALLAGLPTYFTHSQSTQKSLISKKKQISMLKIDMFPCATISSTLTFRSFVIILSIAIISLGVIESDGLLHHDFLAINLR